MKKEISLQHQRSLPEALNCFVMYFLEDILEDLVSIFVTSYSINHLRMQV